MKIRIAVTFYRWKLRGVAVDGYQIHNCVFSGLPNCVFSGLLWTERILLVYTRNWTEVVLWVCRDPTFFLLSFNRKNYLAIKFITPIGSRCVDAENTESISLVSLHILDWSWYLCWIVHLCWNLWRIWATFSQVFTYRWSKCNLPFQTRHRTRYEI